MGCSIMRKRLLHRAPVVAQAFQDPTVALAYRYRPPYPAAVFEILAELVRRYVHDRFPFHSCRRLMDPAWHAVHCHRQDKRCIELPYRQRRRAQAREEQIGDHIN
jgi:hypothetical protein